ncbi:MAG: glycyl radical protein [Acidobacteria bacterium]|nr:glycyl radical protein [Acidobacteriota bacterium]
MNERVKRLRQASLDAEPSISAERALLLTGFYRENEGKHPVPVLRAMAFRHLCEHKAVYIGPGELIVGERGPFPKATPTYPELTCHSLDDLRILGSREKTRYAVSEDVLRAYAQTVIPFWSGRSMRDRIFRELPDDWKEAFEAGVFTEFMEQRAPGHTVADGKIYRRGLLDVRREIAERIDALDFEADPEALDRRDQLRAMDIACEAVIRYAGRHAEAARQLAAGEPDAARRAELEKIAAVCGHVPANAPRSFHEALQAYWFCHLAVITELNGWDAFSPGRLDQHLFPFYRAETAAGTLSPDEAVELLQCFWIKFNNHPAPPKVGVTAAESGTYTDFANISLGGLTRDGGDGVNPLSHVILDVIEAMQILQPSSNVQISRKTPEDFLRHACRVIRRGFGFPSVFNADAVAAELVRQGKSIEDARDGGTSGCVEAGAFGKEAYILTGYFNLVKVLELTLNDGFDPRTGRQLGLRTGKPGDFNAFDDFFRAWQAQVRHFVDVKARGNRIVERLYARYAPAPFLSVLIDDCVARGKDYNAGGARYNTTYIQGVGIGTLTDAFSAVKTLVFDQGLIGLGDLAQVLSRNFEGNEVLRLRLAGKAPRYGNDDDAADDLMRACFETFFRAVDGRPNGRGGRCHVDMLPTTCHVYFGAVTGATPDGRRAGEPLSEGISPVQGADRKGPTAVVRSAAKMDQLKTGGTLLNQKFSPGLLAGEEGIANLAGLIRGYFRLDGHHLQFNVVTAETLRKAQEDPAAHAGLIVRVAGYSDYFCDLGRALQDEIIARTAHEAF